MPDLGTPNTGGVTTGTRNVGSLAGATPNTGGKAAATVNTGSKAAATVLAGTVANVANTGALEASTTNSGNISAGYPNRNVIEILLDDGGPEWFDGWTHLQEPASGYALTPRLDAFRAQGVTFTRAYAMPICSVTRGVNETGRYPFRQGQELGGNIEPDDQFGFGLTNDGLDGDGVPDPTAETTILGLARAIRLGRNGLDDTSIGVLNFTYAIAWWGKVHLCKDTEFEGYAIAQKYGRYQGCMPNVPEVVDDGINPPDAEGGHFHWIDVGHSANTSPTYLTYGSGDAWTLGGADFVAWDSSGTPKRAWDAYKNIRDAILWANSRTQPFFMKLCMNPPHLPFEVPPYTCPDDIGVDFTGGTRTLVSAGTQAACNALDGGSKGPGYHPTVTASKKVTYKAGIEAVDSLIGLLYDRLDPAIRENTVFIFMGDNGTVGDVIDSPYDPAHAKRTIYEQGQRVPLLIWDGGAFITSPGRDCDHLVHTSDMFPTILDVCRAETALWNPDGVTIDGRSLLRVLTDPDAPAPRAFIFTEFFLPNSAYEGGTDENAIDYAAAKRSYSDGTHKLIRWNTGAPAPYSLFNITSAVQPGSGAAGYFEMASDDLYGTIGSNPTNAAIFNALNSAMTALLASS